MADGVEVWKTVEEFPIYEVSSLGRVRSVDRESVRRGNVAKIKGAELKQTDIRGYKRVTLYYGSRKNHAQIFVHRLVARAFIPNPDNLPCVNHKDENPSNNCYWNLEWCTHKYNSNYGTSIERRVKHQDWESIAKKQAVPVAQYDMDGKLVSTWESMMQCERSTDFKCSGIARCCAGTRKSYRGFIWKKIR